MWKGTLIQFSVQTVPKTADCYERLTWQLFTALLVRGRSTNCLSLTLDAFLRTWAFWPIWHNFSTRAHNRTEPKHAIVQTDMVSCTPDRALHVCCYESGIWERKSPPCEIPEGASSARIIARLVQHQTQTRKVTIVSVILMLLALQNKCENSDKY